MIIPTSRNSSQSKRTAGKIEHANLSVCISDKFMQAVKDDADWDLIWQGEVKKAIRARSLWDLICTSAWDSAEPGVVFMDRYNKLSNTWYYEDIRCVNPCVTGDTLIYTDDGLTPAKELAVPGLPITVVSPDITIKELAFAGHDNGTEQSPEHSQTEMYSCDKQVMSSQQVLRNYLSNSNKRRISAYDLPKITRYSP